MKEYRSTYTDASKTDSNNAFSRAAWLEINTENLANNIREVRRIVPAGTDVMAAVKANGYGHGALPVARTLLENGADCLAVALIQEGVELRREGISAPILVLGYTAPQEWEAAVKSGLALTIWTAEQARGLSRLADRLDTTVNVHCKVDTGMGRLGVLAEEAAERVEYIACSSGLNLQGVFTHLATADERDESYTRLQMRRFRTLLAELDERGIELQAHMANSAGVINYTKEAALDLVRPGIILYGLPAGPVCKADIELKPALSLKAYIAHVKTLPPNHGISYGKTYTTSKETRVATIPVGYADGYDRLLSNNGEVLISGCRCPVVGRVCMDQFMVRLREGVQASPGDEAVLIGRQDGEEISATELAERIGTINYEVVSRLAGRLPRYYTG